jgi:hypothetical protein
VIRLPGLKLCELMQHLGHRIFLHLHVMHEPCDEKLITRQRRHTLADALALPHRDQPCRAEQRHHQHEPQRQHAQQVALGDAKDGETHDGSIDETIADGEAHQLADGVQIELFHDAAAMRLDGVHAQTSAVAISLFVLLSAIICSTSRSRGESRSMGLVTCLR